MWLLRFKLLRILIDISVFLIVTYHCFSSLGIQTLFPNQIVYTQFVRFVSIKVLSYFIMFINYSNDIPQTSNLAHLICKRLFLHTLDWFVSKLIIESSLVFTNVRLSNITIWRINQLVCVLRVCLFDGFTLSDVSCSFCISL